jgi:hypothetical protein
MKKINLQTTITNVSNAADVKIWEKSGLRGNERKREETK